MRVSILVAVCALTTSCAFDLVRVKQIPTALESARASQPALTLEEHVRVALGTGYSRVLKQGTTWKHVGTITEGEVYRTDDQVLTVEASNIYEAYIVVLDGRLVGFYLPVEKAFSPIRRSRELPLRKT